MSIRTAADIVADIIALITDNGVGDISGSDVRTMMVDLAESGVEIVKNNGALTGAANASDKFGYDENNGNIYYVDAAGNWQSAAGTAPAATEAIAGILEIATQAETDAGTADNLAITPLKLSGAQDSDRTKWIVENVVDFTTAEPAHAADAVYINNTTGTGSITTGTTFTQNYLYRSDGAAWTEFIPAEGWQVWEKTSDQSGNYDGAAWVFGVATSGTVYGPQAGLTTGTGTVTWDWTTDGRNAIANSAIAAEAISAPTGLTAGDAATLILGSSNAAGTVYTFDAAYVDREGNSIGAITVPNGGIAAIEFFSSDGTNAGSPTYPEGGNQHLLNSDLTADATHTQSFENFGQNWNNLGVLNIDQENSLFPGVYAGAVWTTSGVDIDSIGAAGNSGTFKTSSSEAELHYAAGTDAAGMAPIAGGGTSERVFASSTSGGTFDASMEVDADSHAELKYVQDTDEVFLRLESGQVFLREGAVNAGTAVNGQILALIDNTTGEVRFTDPAAITWQFSATPQTVAAGESWVVYQNDTVNIPPAPTAGDVIQFAPGNASWDAMNVTFDNGASADTILNGQTLPDSSDVLVLVYDAGNTNWVGFLGAGAAVNENLFNSDQTTDAARAHTQNHDVVVTSTNSEWRFDTVNTTFNASGSVAISDSGFSSIITDNTSTRNTSFSHNTLRALMRATDDTGDIVEVAAENVAGVATLKVVTPNVNGGTATNGQVLTLADDTTGEVEFQNSAAGFEVGLTSHINNGGVTTVNYNQATQGNRALGTAGLNEFSSVFSDGVGFLIPAGYDGTYLVIASWTLTSVGERAQVFLRLVQSGSSSFNRQVGSTYIRNNVTSQNRDVGNGSVIFRCVAGDTIRLQSVRGTNSTVTDAVNPAAINSVQMHIIKMT